MSLKIKPMLIAMITLLLITSAASGISSVDQGFQAAWFIGDAANGTIGGISLSSLITGLQNNDTTDRAYVNTTFLPIATYAGDFPNSSLSNYVLTALYNGNFPNQTVENNLNTWNATYNSTYDALITSKVNKTDAGELSGGTLLNARLDDDITYRSIQMTVYNSSGAIATWMKAQIFNVPINGTIETLELQNGAADGNINMSVLLAASGIPIITDLEGQINITAGNAASKTVSIPVVFGDRLKFYVDANAGDVTSTTISLRIKVT